MERGEVDGRGTFSWTSIRPHRAKLIDSGELVILFQMGLRRHPELPNVPLITELAQNADQKAVLELQFTAFELGRPYFVADGVPADRVKVLRAAFDASMKDKVLLEDVEKQQLEVNPVSGEEMQKIMERTYKTPKALVARLQEASKEQPDLKVLAPLKAEGGKGEAKKE